MLRRIIATVLLMALALSALAIADAGETQASKNAAEARTADENGEKTEEAGYGELERLMSTCDSMDMDGMSFEDISAAYINNALAEYLDGNTGFSVLYPAVLSKQMDGDVTGFTSEDGKAAVTIEAIAGDKALSVKELENSIHTGNPDAKTTVDETTGCLRSDYSQEDGTEVMDLYLPTEKWLHHVRYTYPKADEETYGIYKDYIMNSMQTDELALG